jgi:hypothetical protein
LTWRTADEIGYPGNLFTPDSDNFGPRVGISFMIDERTAIRGAYGEYFWPMPLSQILKASRIQPPLNLRFYNFLNYKDGTKPSTNVECLS